MKHWFFTKENIEIVKSIAIKSGVIACEMQKLQNFEIKKKPDNSLVTSADIAISDFVYKNLSVFFPQIPIICEERKVRNFNEDIFWLIDPIDGTSSFIKGKDQFCINIALIEKNKPIFGIIFAPKFEGGKLAFLNENQELKIEYSSQKSFENNHFENFRIVASNKSFNQEIFNYVKQFHSNFIDNYSVEYLSAATKFFPLLENKADLYLCFKNIMEWDIAAGHALINAKGGVLKKITKQNNFFTIKSDMDYKKQNFINDFFACYNYFAK